MKSKAFVRRISISNGARDRVLLEEDLGEMEEVAYVGGSMFEIRGTNEVIRVELGQSETEKLMNAIRARAPRWGAIKVPRNERRSEQAGRYPCKD